MFMNGHNVNHDAHDDSSKYHDAVMLSRLLSQSEVSHIYGFLRATANTQYSQSQPHADAILFGRG